MSETTAIEWTDATWSPWEGCTKVGPGCTNCYAEGMNKWLRKGENWGPGAPRRQYGDDHWKKPLRWNAKAEKEGKQLRIFPSVCDPFDNEVPAEWRVRFFDLIAATPNLTWLLLTKRIGNAAPMMREAWRHDTDPPRNVWLGSTIVTQEEYDRDIGKLLRTPATVRFLSIEPMLGAIDMRMGGASMPDYADHRPLPKLDWVICGGESGRGARALHLTWVRDIVRQCRSAGVSVLVKQLGRDVLDNGMSSPGEHWPQGTVRLPIPRRSNADPGFSVRLNNSKGGDWSEWPDDLRVREFPAGRAMVGKAAR